MWKDTTDKQHFRDLDTYFALLCRAQDIFAELNQKHHGYGILWTLTHLDGCDIKLEVTTITPDTHFISRTYWNEKTGELKSFLEKVLDN